MTVAQKRMYKNVLTRNFDVLSKGKNQVSLLNLMMQLRKTCNHSHLILEPEEIAQDDEERCKQLVYGSGKLVLLDKLLARFREKGDRVLIFSQMVMMLNIIEEFLLLKRYQFQRLDGSVSADDRKQSIARFNNKESTDFCFLLSTKAGGLGINLQTANVVIIFDSDFNPQNDLQAIARAHRIGQKDEVKIYRLVASNSVDEDIIQKAKNKMVLDHLVIQRMDTTGQSIIGGGSFKSQNTDGNKLSKDDLNVILKFGAAELFKDEEETEKEGEIDLDAILEQAEVREEVDDDAHQSEANKELLGAFKCTTLSFEETEKEIEAESETNGLDWDAIIPLELRPEKQNETTEIEVLERKLRRKDLTKESLKDTQLNGSRLASHGDDEEEYLINSDDESSEDGSDSESEEDLENPIKKQASKNPMKKEAKETKYLCNKCGKVYADKRGLINHMSAKHQEPKYVLTVENYIKLPKNGTNDQANPVLPVKGVSCLICFKTFSNNERLKGHINRQHLAIYNKNDEGVESQDQSDLIEVQDPVTEPSDVPGENAAMKMSSNTEIKLMDGDNTNNNVKNDSATASQIKPTNEQMVLIEKMLNGMKKYECSHCDQRFSVKAELAKHEKQHTSSTWKYTCAHCELRFPSNARLIQHEKRHDGGNKMACPYCAKTYTIRHYFLAHCTNAHADKPLPASLAEKSVKDPEKEKSSISNFEKENGSDHSVVANTTKEEQPVKVNAVKCLYCEKSYARRDRMVAHCKTAHADKQSVHSDNPLPPSKPVACLYCNKSYTRRENMLLHCKSAHADKPEKSPEKPEKESSSNTALTKEEEHNDADVLKELNPQQVTPSTTGDDDDIICLDDDAEVYDDGTSKRQSVSGKSKEKAFQCPECKKGYSDQKNLDFHVKLTHEAKSKAPFVDVGPDTNIVVTSNNDKGYEVYKVIKVYSTGSRFKCLKYSHLSDDRWTLTQEVNKNVVKANIKKIVTLKKEQDGENVYMDMDELVPMEKKTGVDNGEKEVSDDDKENDDAANVNNSKELTTS